jgi:hypothetical protein
MDLEAFSIAQQVEALLKDRAYDLVKSKYGAFHPEAYSEVFTVTRAEILDYLRCNYKLNQVAKTQSGKDDGFYAISERDGFRVYWQERATRIDFGVVSSEVKAWAVFVEYLIRTSGTGLSFQ